MNTGPDANSQDETDFARAPVPRARVAAGRFTLVQSLGRGGMGEVWLAQDERLNEPVALKFLPAEVRADPVALDDLRRETARSHKLTHTNIVRIHDLHEEPGGMAFIAMEYVDGPTLAGLRLQQPERVLSWEFLRSLVQQLCAALDYAHGEKVIHRDLKPANVMVDGKGRLKLADFGIAATVSDSVSRVSGRHNTSGTLPYMSPQQLAGKRPQVADDIYALGATLYELLTSQPPFCSGDITHQVLHEAPEPLDERLAALGIQNPVPGDVAALIMACLAKEPAQRPPNAASVAAWIGLEIQKESSTQALAESVFSELRPSEELESASTPVRSPGRWWWAGGLFAGLLIAAGLIGWLWWRSPNRRLLGSASEAKVRGVEVVTNAAWMSLDISAACNADVISTGSRKAASQFTFDGATLASASWLQKNGYPDQGLPDSGVVAIPNTSPEGFFIVSMSPAKNAILISGPDGPYPQPVTVELTATDRRSYSHVVILHATCWGNGSLRVTLHYEMGVETTTSIPVLDWFPGGRTGPLPADLRVAVTSHDTHPTGGKVAQMLAQKVIVDPQRILLSMTFSHGSLSAPTGFAERDTRTRFTTGIFAISALTVPSDPKSFGVASRLKPADTRTEQPPTKPTPEMVWDRNVPSLSPGHRWTNSLGMMFVPVLGTEVLFSVWDTRVKDYAVFVKDGANNGGYDYRKGAEPLVLRSDRWKGRGWAYGWENPGFAQTGEHPVVCVSWEDAKAFCRWLTEKEQRAGLIGSEQNYRLPTDLEWSVAVGLAEENGSTPKDKAEKMKGVYPWGTGWPPPAGAGNYAGGEAADANWPSEWKPIEGYRDGYARTSPVGSFRVNRFGLYDMGGNAGQWCEDYYDVLIGNRVLRGGSWRDLDPDWLLSSRRGYLAPGLRIGGVGFRVVLAGESLR